MPGRGGIDSTGTASASFTTEDFSVLDRQAGESDWKRFSPAGAAFELGMMDGLLDGGKSYRGNRRRRYPRRTP